MGQPLAAGSVFDTCKLTLWPVTGYQRSCIAADSMACARGCASCGPQTQSYRDAKADAACNELSALRVCRTQEGCTRGHTQHSHAVLSLTGTKLVQQNWAHKCCPASLSLHAKARLLMQTNQLLDRRSLCSQRGCTGSSAQHSHADFSLAGAELVSPATLGTRQLPSITQPSCQCTPVHGCSFT